MATFSAGLHFWLLSEEKRIASTAPCKQIVKSSWMVPQYATLLFRYVKLQGICYAGAFENGIFSTISLK